MIHLQSTDSVSSAKIPPKSCRFLSLHIHKKKKKGYIIQLDYILEENIIIHLPNDDSGEEVAKKKTLSISIIPSV